MPTEQMKELAKLLHKEFCTHNHADYCGWFYETNGRDSSGDYIDDWDRAEHQTWLEKANKVKGWVNDISS